MIVNKSLLEKKLKEEKEKTKEQARKISSLEAQISYLESRLNSLKASQTYKIGLIFSEAKKPIDFFSIPYKLLVFSLRHLKERKNVKLKTLMAHKQMCDLSSSVHELKKEPDHKKWWYTSEASYKNKEESFYEDFKDVDNVRKTNRFEIKGGASYVFQTSKMVSINSNLTEKYSFRINIEEFGESGQLLDSYTLLGPGDLTFTGDEESCRTEFYICFKVKASEKSSCLSVTFISGDEPGLENPAGIHGYCEQFGISVIVPTYKGRKRIGKLLKSLCNQSAPCNVFEVIVIENGGQDGVESLIDSYSKAHKDLFFKYLYLECASASAARNAGIAAAKKENITFVDDDDWVSDNFVEAMLSSVAGKKEHCVGLSNILDYENEKFVESTITKSIKKSEKNRVISYSDVSPLLTMNACKVMPSFYVRLLKYDHSLSSGEDVCFFGRYFIRFSPCLSLEPSRKGAVYYREVRFGSVSRQEESFEFNVEQRLKVIKNIDREVAFSLDKEKMKFSSNKISAQSSFISTFLERNISEYSKYVDCIGQQQLCSYQLHRALASKLSSQLIYSYCFFPYADTAAVVMGKRIRERGRPVDVIYNSMRSVRNVDMSLESITRGYVGRRKEVRSPTSFSTWSGMEQYANKAISIADAMVSERGKEYPEIYSRAMWPGSHFAAALHKVKKPFVKWVAEFSDPVLKDVFGQERYCQISYSWLVNKGIVSAVLERMGNVPETRNAFYWCEFLPYVLADEIVFTNRNQLKYMMSYMDNEKLRRIVYKKCKIAPHPTLPSLFYNMSDPGYKVEDNYVNFAYFGSFYATRGLDDVFRAINEISEELRSKLMLHIFTNDVDFMNQVVLRYCLSENVVVNSYVGFLEFLALTNKMDVLVVNDAATIGVKEVNPYLPSKYSDYLGSTAKIWGICEPGSVLEAELVDKESSRSYVSHVDNYNSVLTSLEAAIVEAKAAL